MIPHITRVLVLPGGNKGTGARQCGESQVPAYIVSADNFVKVLLFGPDDKTVFLTSGAKGNTVQIQSSGGTNEEIVCAADNCSFFGVVEGTSWWRRIMTTSRGFVAAGRSTPVRERISPRRTDR
jgi:hypothetical protein